MAIINLLASKNWIPFFKPLAAHFKDNDTAILLSELANRHQFYEQRGELTPDGYFYVTVEKLEQEINMSKYKQSQAVKRLEQAGLIVTKLKGVPATRHFKFPKSFDIQMSKILTSSSPLGRQQEVKKFDTIENYNIENTLPWPDAKLSAKPDKKSPPDCAAPPHGVPAEEARIVEALEKAIGFFDQYPAMRKYMVEKAKLKPEDVDLDFALEDWIRYHSDNITLMQDPGAKINSSFQRWLMREKSWKKPSKAGNNARGKTTSPTPDQLQLDRQHYGRADDSQSW